MCETKRYKDATDTIKRAILRSQYRAARATNAEQLGLYYAIGGFVSTNTRDGFWGQGALSSISERLQKELPGLRGFSERNLKYMRTFYEAWSPLLESGSANSALPSAESGEIAIRQLEVPSWDDEMRESFLGVGFTLHRIILERVKPFEERLYYIKLCAREHLRVEDLKRVIRNDDYHHQSQMPNNFLETMPEEMRALRAIETFKDEYLHDFINIEELGARDENDVDERVVEQAIVNNVKNFIMEFGRGVLVHRQCIPPRRIRRGPVRGPGVLQPRPQLPSGGRTQARQV